MTVQAVKRGTTSTEFLKWITILDEVDYAPDRRDHYLMQIAAEVRRSRAAHPEAVLLKDFRLEFTDEKQKKVEAAALTPEQRLAATKAKYFVAVGLDPTGKKFNGGRQVPKKRPEQRVGPAPRPSRRK